MKISELFEEEERSVLSVMGEQPEHIEKGFNCNELKLTSLKGSPKSTGSYFNCSYNKLKSLEGISSSIGYDLHAQYNDLESLHNIHKQIKKVNGYVHLNNNKIKSHVLGLLLIEGITYVYFSDKYSGKLYSVEKIINKHLKNGRDIFACQEELIENGFEAFAQL